MLGWDLAEHVDETIVRNLVVGVVYLKMTDPAGVGIKSVIRLMKTAREGLVESIRL